MPVISDPIIPVGFIFIPDNLCSEYVNDSNPSGVIPVIKKALDSGLAAPESLRHVANQPGVSSILIGTIDPLHLEDDVAALSLDST